MPDKITAKAPWVKNLGDIPAHLDYFQGSMYDMLKSVADKYPNNIAMDFMGRSTTYRQLLEHVERCAKALKTIGIRENDCVTIAMPNCPQAIAMFYAINMVGGIANMVHPLSSEKEIEFYLNESNSVTVITLDQFYHKIEAIRNNTNIVNVIIASIRDELSQPLKTGYMLTEGRKIRKIPDDAPVIRWQKFLNLSKSCFWRYKVERKPEDPAVILYSGGTTGTTKGIVLTNLNFNALSQQVIATNPMFRPGDRMLAAMPIFHGFGLGVCIHTMLTQGGRCVLVPRFTAKSYSKLITKYKCNFIAGVPTLYEALLRLPNMEKADLSSLKGVFSGGDSLTIELKKKFDKFLYDHKAVIQIREGYGTTECVTASCLTPPTMHREGSIGLPFPDTYYKIVTPGTDEELPYGHIVRKSDGSFSHIVEDKDCTPEEKAIRELNVGVYVFESGPLWEAIDQLRPNNAQGEYYLTDAPAYILSRGGRVGACPTCTAEEMLGVNTVEQLAQVEELVRRREGLK